MPSACSFTSPAFCFSCLQHLFSHFASSMTLNSWCPRGGRISERCWARHTLADLQLHCCGTAAGEQGAMPTLPNLNSLGKLCSSSRSHSVHRVNRVRVKRKSSVKRMSIIEDGHVAEVLYLIPKQYMEQFPFLNPDDYYMSEKLNDVTAGRKTHNLQLLPILSCP